MTEGQRNSRWRQGQLLNNEAARALGLLYEPDAGDSLVIIASHDCDLASNPDREPFVEVIVGQKVVKDGNHTHAKNPRKLHIEFTGESLFWGEFEANRKRSIDKIGLRQYVPVASAWLNAESRATFQFWLASRYRRAAFPDEFERRLSANGLSNFIAKRVKPHGDLITGLFFDVDNGDDISRNSDDTYMLDITILYIADENFIAAKEAASAIAHSISSEFERKLLTPTHQWKEIELRSCEAVSEASLTYQDYKSMKRWRLDYMSLGADPQQPAPAE